MKICTKCKRDLEIEDFDWKFKDIKRKSRCKSCVAEYSKEHYKANAEKHKKIVIAHSKRYVLRNRTYVYNYLKQHPCSCGESDPVALDFDHIDPNTKIDTISNMAGSSGSLERLKREIAKCIILCSNCHRKKTAKDFNWYADLNRE